MKLNSNGLQACPTTGFWGQTAVKAQLNIDQPHTKLNDPSQVVSGILKRWGLEAIPCGKQTIPS